MDSITQEVINRVADTLERQVESVRFLSTLNEQQYPMASTAPLTAAGLQTMAYNLVQQFSAVVPEFDHMAFYARCGFVVSSNYPYVIAPK